MSLNHNHHVSGERSSVWGSGLLAVDVVIRGLDGPVVEITSGGTCANVLANLAVLGWQAEAKGRIGDDHAGSTLVDALRAGGVSTASLIRERHVSTPIIVERFGIGSETAPRHRFEWTCPCCGAPVPRYRPTPIGMLLDQSGRGDIPDVFFFDRATPGNIRLAERLKASGSFVVFEPPSLKDDRDIWKAVAVADVVKIAATSPPVEIDARLLSCSLVIVTLGSQGLQYRASGFQGVTQDWRSLPAINLDRTVDSCGSGDWLTAGFLHALLSINDVSGGVIGKVEASLRYGQALSALNCLLPGARGLSRVFSRVEIADMVAITLAQGPSCLEHTIQDRSTQTGRFVDVRAVCGTCSFA